MPKHFIGVDVGTGSARAGVFDAGGKLLGVAKQDIALYREGGTIAEQSSNDIWRTVCTCVREAVRSAGVTPDSIAGLGFDASWCGLGYGARQIIEAERQKGIHTDTIVVSGGAGKSDLARQILADATRLVVTSSTSPEPVLLGSTMLGAVAGGALADLTSAMTGMSKLGQVHELSQSLRDWHDQRYRIFCALQEIGRDLTGAKPAGQGH